MELGLNVFFAFFKQFNFYKAKGRRKKQNLNQHRETPDENASNIRKPQKEIPKSGTKSRILFIVARDSMVKNLKGSLMSRKKYEPEESRKK